MTDVYSGTIHPDIGTITFEWEKSEHLNTVLIENKEDDNKVSLGLEEIKFIIPLF